MENTGSLVLVRQGAQRAVSKWGVLGLLYAVNLLLTLPLAMMFRSAMSVMVGNAPIVDELFPGFAYSVFSDLMRAHADAVTVFRNAFGPVAMISIVVHAILGVGLVRVMDTNGGAREFFGGIVSFGWRAFRLFLVWLLFALVLLAVAGFLGVMLFQVVTEGNATEDAYLTGAGIVVLLVGFAVVLISLGAEYSRVVTVRENRDSMFKAAWDGLSFVVRHPVRMIMLHGSVLVVLVLATLLYWLVEDVIGMTSVLGVIIMLIVQQAYILFRLGTRMWHTANAVRMSALLAESKRPPYVQAPSLHQRGTSYREQMERQPREEQTGRTSGEPEGDARTEAGTQVGQRGRPGYRRRGRRRGGSGRGGSSPDQNKPGTQPPPPKQEGQSSAPTGQRPRRRRRPPRRPGGNA